MGNGYRIEFTQARCEASAAKKIVSLNQVDLDGNREEEEVEEANFGFGQ